MVSFYNDPHTNEGEVGKTFLLLRGRIASGSVILDTTHAGGSSVVSSHVRAGGESRGKKMNWNQKLVACWGIGKNSIEKETAKALLINGLGWIPKSQCELGSKERNPFMIIPAWLARKVMDNYSILVISESEKAELIECIS